MKKRNRLFLEKKAENKKYKGLSAELREQIKRAKQGQGVIISNKYRPRHHFKIGAIVDIIATCSRNGDKSCEDSQGFHQWVDQNDLIVKGK